MEIQKVRLTRTKVSITYSNNGEEHSVSSNERPLKAFIDSIAALKPLILATCELPESYAGREPTKEEDDKEQCNPLRPTGITISTKGDARSVCITATKVLSRTVGPMNLCVPLRLIDHPTEEGAVSTPYSDAEVEVIENVIQCAKDYINGERAQGTLPLEAEKTEDEDGEAEPSQGDTLQFTQSAANGTGTPAKKRKRSE